MIDVFSVVDIHDNTHLQQTVIVHSPYLLFVWRACGAKRDISILYEEIMTPKGTFPLETFTVDSKVTWTCLYNNFAKMVCLLLYVMPSVTCTLVSLFWLNTAVLLSVLVWETQLCRSSQHSCTGHIRGTHEETSDCWNATIWKVHCGQVTSVMIEGVLQHN